MSEEGIKIYIKRALEEIQYALQYKAPVQFYFAQEQMDKLLGQDNPEYLDPMMITSGADFIDEMKGVFFDLLTSSKYQSLIKKIGYNASEVEKEIIKEKMENPL